MGEWGPQGAEGNFDGFAVINGIKSWFLNFVKIAVCWVLEKKKQLFSRR